MKISPNDIRKREALKAVMDGEMFNEAIEDVRRQLADGILRSNLSEERERLYQEASLLTRLQSTLESYTNDLLFMKTAQTPVKEPVS